MEVIDHSESPPARSTPKIYRVPRKVPEMYLEETLTDSDYEDEVARKNDQGLLNLGFIGADDFGFDIAKAIMTEKKGASYHFWSKNTEKKVELEKLGGTFTSGIKTVFNNADIIFYFVPGDKEARNLLFKTDVFRCFKKGKCLVLMATVPVTTAEAIQTSITDRAGRYLELLPCRLISKRGEPLNYACCGDKLLGKMISPIFQSITGLIYCIGERAGTALKISSCIDPVRYDR